MFKVLVMGLAGAGKTILTEKIKIALEEQGIECDWFNGDEVRERTNNWDFSIDGRIAQAIKMNQLAEDSKAEIVLCDFVAPTKEIRDIFDADYTIWVDSISTSEFELLNSVFVAPTNADYIIKDRTNVTHVIKIVNEIIKEL